MLVKDLRQWRCATHNFNHTDVYKLVSRDADPPVSCVRVYCWSLSLSFSFPRNVYVHAEAVVGSRVIAFHKCRTKFFNKICVHEIYNYFCYFVCLFWDSVLYTIGRTIIWHEAHTTHNMFIVYNLNFICDNFALAAVSVSVAPHNNTHTLTIDSAQSVCFESSAKTPIVWPVARNCYCTYCIWSITWYLIVFLLSPKVHLQRILK